jgi:hypothetical protein
MERIFTERCNSSFFRDIPGTGKSSIARDVRLGRTDRREREFVDIDARWVYIICLALLMVSEEEFEAAFTASEWMGSTSFLK